MSTSDKWLESPVKFDAEVVPKSDHKEETHFLVVEDFLPYTYEALTDVLNQCDFISVPSEECKVRRCSGSYVAPDSPRPV